MRQALEYLIGQTDKAALDVKKDIKWSRLYILGVTFILPLFAFISGELGIIVLGVFSAGIPALFIVYQRVRYAQQIGRMKRLQPPPASWFANSALNQIIKEAQSNLVPKITQIDVRLNLVSEIGASAYQTHNSAVLVVTLGLVKLASRHPDRARGVVHHEMAHLLHEDTELFDLAMSISRGLSVYVFCILAVLVVAYFVTVLDSGWYNPFSVNIPGAAPLAITMLNINRINNARLQSEVLADIRAASVVGPQVMIEAITTCVKPETTEMFEPWTDGNYLRLQVSSNDSLHPHRDERLFVLRWMGNNQNQQGLASLARSFE